MLSTKSKKATKWSSKDKPIFTLNLGRCFKYPSRKLLSILRSCKVAYLAWMISQKASIFEDEDELVQDVVDDEVEYNEALS